MGDPSVQEASSPESLVGQMADEFLERQQRGERPDVEEYAARHPEAADLLRKVLLSLQVLDLSQSLTGDGLGTAAGEPAPRELGDFRLLREVGRGGMGIVYEAEQLSLGRRVALKVLPFAATMDPRHLQRFQNEARAAASLEHPHIVPIYGVGCERAVHFYAMKFIEGQALDALVDSLRVAQGRHHAPRDDRALDSAESAILVSPNGKHHVERDDYLGNGETIREPRGHVSTLPSPRQHRAYYHRIAELALQAADALEHGHQSGVIHRDIKPANLLLDTRGNMWVTDFGLAHIQSDARMTLTGDLVGTLRYMSPEQALAKRVIVDHRIDIYSLGATLYELLTLQPAFLGQDRQELLRQIAFEEPIPPRRVNRAIPVELETIVGKAMEKNAADRYATAKEMADDLKRFLKDEPTLARRPTIWRRGRKWSRRQKAAVRAGAVVLGALAVMMAMGAVWLRDRAFREAETERALTGLLKESEGLQTERKTPEALAKVRQAKQLLANGTATSALIALTEMRLDDLNMARNLEEIRSQRTTETGDVKDTGVSGTQIADMYKQAFRAFGIDVDQLPAEDVVRRIGRRSIAVEVAAALDDWSAVVKAGSPPDDAPWKRLLAMARDADPDPLRSRLREALEKNQVQDLTDLANSITANKQAMKLAPATITTFAKALQACRAMDEVVLLLRHGQKAYSTDFWINLQLADAVEHCDPPNYYISAIYYTAAVTIRPQSAPVHFRLGMAFAKLGRYADALAAFETALRLKPDFSFARNNAAVAFAQMNDIDSAIANSVAAIHSDPANTTTHMNLVMRLDARGNQEKVQTELRKFFGSGLKLALAQNAYGVLLEKREQLDDALDVFRQNVVLNPKSAVAHEKLGGALFKREQWSDAAEVYRKCIALEEDYEPSFLGPRTLLGHALYKSGDLQEAFRAFQADVAYYKAKTKANPKKGALHSQLSFLLVSCPDHRIWDPKRALEEAKLGLMLDRRWWGTLGTLGGAHYRNGQLNEAEEVLKESLKSLSPSSLSGTNELFFLAMAQWNLDKKELAKQTYAQGLKRMERLQPMEHRIALYAAEHLRAEAAELLGIGAVAPQDSGLSSWWSWAPAVVASTPMPEKKNVPAPK